MGRRVDGMEEERECCALLQPPSEHCSAVLFAWDESTSLPGFRAPTRPYRARGTGRREPWERGWGRVGLKLP